MDSKLIDDWYTVSVYGCAPLPSSHALISYAYSSSILASCILASRKFMCVKKVVEETRGEKKTIVDPTSETARLET